MKFTVSKSLARVLSLVKLASSTCSISIAIISFVDLYAYGFKVKNFGPMMIGALMLFVLFNKKGLLVAPYRLRRIQPRPYLVLKLELSVNIVCIDSIDGLPRRRGEEIIPTLARYNRCSGCRCVVLPK